MLGERVSRLALLADVDALFAHADAQPDRARRASSSASGPGSFTGCAWASRRRAALALALDVPVAGVSTLDALAAGRRAPLPVIDAATARGLHLIDGEPGGRRRATSTSAGHDVSETEPSATARSSRQRGREVPPDDSELHVASRARPRSRSRASFGPAELVEPIYVRAPDADKGAKR